MKIIVYGNKIVQKHKNMLRYPIYVKTAIVYMFKIQIQRQNAFLKQFVRNTNIIKFFLTHAMIAQSSKFRILLMKLCAQLNKFVQKHNSLPLIITCAKIALQIKL